MPTTVEALESIRARTFEPIAYEEVVHTLKCGEKMLLDYIVGLNKKFQIPKTREIAEELEWHLSYLYGIAKKLGTRSLIIRPTIYELLAVFGLYRKLGRGISWSFEREELNRMLYSDLLSITPTAYRGDGKGIRKIIEETRVGYVPNGTMYWKYHIALVSTNDIPVYSSFFYSDAKL